MIWLMLLLFFNRIVPLPTSLNDLGLGKMTMSSGLLPGPPNLLT
jgi:hypothetical protein